MFKITFFNENELIYERPRPKHYKSYCLINESYKIYNLINPNHPAFLKLYHALHYKNAPRKSNFS